MKKFNVIINYFVLLLVLLVDVLIIDVCDPDKC